jgi:hypothetical protein
VTKPIEGWVGSYENTTASHYSNDIPYGEFYAVVKHKPLSSPFEWRPVRITFTDEAAPTIADIAKLSVAELENILSGRGESLMFAEAIRKERERIWDKIQDIDLRIPDWVSLQRAIFGEGEK